MISIPTQWRNYLLGSPEYGMGYQKATIRFATGSIESGFIFNASTFIKSEELGSLSSSQLWMAEWRLSLQTSNISVSDITLIPRPPETLIGVRRVGIQFANVRAYNVLENASFVKASQAAKDAPTTITTVGEVFKRFSAYTNDFRITGKKGLVAGTFATTAEDAENIKTGNDAIKRYALENKQSANKRFTINPAQNTNLKKGIAQPAYGEPGGGIEVIFVDGTSDNTVSGPDILPE